MKLKQNKTYTTRVYKPSGELAQKPFVHKSRKILFPGNTIEILEGIYDSKYKIVAIGRVGKDYVLDSEEFSDAEIEGKSKFELDFTPSGLSSRINKDYIEGGDKIEGTKATIFVHPTKYQEPIEDAVAGFGSCGHILDYLPNIRPLLALGRNYRDKISNLVGRTSTFAYYGELDSDRISRANRELDDLVISMSDKDLYLALRFVGAKNKAMFSFGVRRSCWKSMGNVIQKKYDERIIL